MRAAESQSHSDTQYLSLSNFDKLVDQLRIFSAQINDRNIEVTRLQELCTKHNIDFAIAPQQVVLPANKAVTPPDAHNEESTPVIVTPPSVENK